MQLLKEDTGLIFGLFLRNVYVSGAVICLRLFLMVTFEIWRIDTVSERRHVCLV